MTRPSSVVLKFQCTETIIALSYMQIIMHDITKFCQLPQAMLIIAAFLLSSLWD